VIEELVPMCSLDEDGSFDRAFVVAADDT